MRDDLPENDLGAVGYLDTMVRAFSKIDEHDAERMRIAISIPHRQPVSIVRSSLATCYLRLFKRIEGITDEQALDLIIKNAPHFIHMSAKDMHIFLKETHFCTKLSQLIESADPQLKLTDPHVIAKAYVVKAYLMSLDYQKSKDGSTDAVELAMIDACDKALKLNEDLLEAHVIKAMAYQSLGVKGNDEAMSQMQRALIKATLVMDKHHFKLKDVYLFKTLIHMVKMQGWKTSWIAALEEKYGDKKEVA